MCLNNDVLKQTCIIECSHAFIISHWSKVKVSLVCFNRWGFDSVSDPVVHSMKISHLHIWYIWYFTESWKERATYTALQYLVTTVKVYSGQIKDYNKYSCKRQASCVLLIGRVETQWFEALNTMNLVLIHVAANYDKWIHGNWEYMLLLKNYWCCLMHQTWISNGMHYISVA